MELKEWGLLLLIKSFYYEVCYKNKIYIEVKYFPSSMYYLKCSVYFSNLYVRKKEKISLKLISN